MVLLVESVAARFRVTFVPFEGKTLRNVLLDGKFFDMAAGFGIF